MSYSEGRLGEALDELLGKLNEQLAGSDDMVLMALLGVAIGLPPNCR